MTKEVILLISKNCPHCPIAKIVWESFKRELDLKLKIIDALSEEGKLLTSIYNIRSVPAAIVDRKHVIIGIPNRDEVLFLIKKS